MARALTVAATAVGFAMAAAGSIAEPTTAAPGHRDNPAGAHRALIWVGPSAISLERGHCTGRRVETLVRRFAAAFNEGNLQRLDHIFASARSGFGWYSTDGPGSRLNAAAFNRSTLIGYFARRHAQGERLELVSVRFNGNDIQGYGDFQYALFRSARDLTRTQYEGKGAALCRKSGDKIGIWSMGHAS